MTHFWKLLYKERLQVTLYVILAGLVFILTNLAHSADNLAFQRFFRSLSPQLMVSAIILTGLLLSTLLIYTHQFSIYRRGNQLGPVIAIGLSLPFAVVMILIDRYRPFPKHMNTAFPNSIAFYPVMAFVVEILFHLLPVALLFFLFLRHIETAKPDRNVWIVFLGIALIEPVFQVVLGKDQNTIGVITFLGLFLFVFNFVQLELYRRYDFLSMYAFRISYYVIWHIVWGHLRLSLLF